eukprot:scaffold2918_cov142-Skeletonema_menzelii.AAC.2
MMRRHNTRSSGAISTALRWCLLTTAALYATKPTAVSAEEADIFFTREETEAISAQCENLDYVTGPLYASDADGNGVLSQDEFVVFTDIVSGGWLSDMGVAGSFQDMPLVLQEANVVLTCLCELYSTQPWGQPGCCDNTATSGIRTHGTGPDEKPDDVQLEYLTYVCGTMSETLGRLSARLVAPPSSSPSAHPSASPSLKPTMKPTLQPTLSPITASPTISPSQSPTTSSPTGTPTTASPTGKPTTLSPTSMPTSSPVTTSPTMSPIDPDSPTKSPAATPSTNPSVAPTSAAPTASPIATASSEPSVSLFSGAFPLLVNFVQYLDGKITAEAISKAETNQVKEKMEDALLTLANLVIEELKNPQKRRELMLRRRELLVQEATDAIVTDVQDIQCTPGLPANVTDEDNCLAWDANIVLQMVDEADPNGRADEIRQLILSKISTGWIDDENNFNQTEALKPKSVETVELNQEPLGIGGKVGIALAALGLVLVVALFATNKAKNRRDGDGATEERNAVKDSDTLANDLDPNPTDDVSEVTETFSYASGAYLLHGQKDSSGGSALEKVPDESEDESFYDPSVGGDEEGGFVDGKENESSQNASYLAAMGAASTLVASTSRKTPRSSPAEENSFFTPESATGSAVSAVGASSPAGGAGTASAGVSSGEGISNVAAAGIGGAVALTAGAVAAGAYVATKKEESEDEDYIGEVEPVEKETPMTSTSQMDELDIAIEAGDWGHVGALAAILAAEGRRTPTQGLKSPRSITSGDGASSRSRGTSTNQSIDQARAAEIDKLVEAGDWQGVVLAAARFEADQTMDGESHSATSASRSSKWSGSGRSSASGTQRSFGTTHSSHEAGRSQAEIRAEVEALVRRVVPEEADNVDEMLNQFKGREEELVETLRRMQERAIASRARLAVQKSVKLEAKARARSATSVKTNASQGSSMELEQAIEEGNWLAVGQAAQKISDQNEGGLTTEDKERLRQKISQSPAMNSQAFSAESVNLDELIEKGDWSGVIAAAKAASEGGSVSNSGNISKEEQDALAQASMWQAIANQSKQDGGAESSGAGDAADWAISRSLNALNTPGETQSRTINDIADEESSDPSQYESASYSKSPDYKGSMV